MITRVELHKDGSRRVYHRTEGGSFWTHGEAPEDLAACRVCGRVLTTPSGEAKRRQDHRRASTDVAPSPGQP